MKTLALSFFSCALALHAYPLLYSVTGTFGAVQNGGPDLLHLSGQPFTISGAIDSASPPSSSPCAANCIYGHQNLRLVIHSLHLNVELSDVPVTLSAGNPGTIAIEARVLWVPFTAVVKLDLPAAAPQPFRAESIVRSGSTVTYGRWKNRTILDIVDGKVSATAPTSLTVPNSGSSDLPGAAPR